MQKELVLIKAQYSNAGERMSGLETGQDKVLAAIEGIKKAMKALSVRTCELIYKILTNPCNGGSIIVLKYSIAISISLEMHRKLADLNYSRSSFRESHHQST